MEGMVGHGEIPLGSALYLQGVAIYKDNIEGIISTAQKHHVPVLFSALVSNLHDQPPFVSTLSAGSGDEQKESFRRALDEGDSCMRVEENPYAQMKLGVIMLQTGDAPGAAGELERGFIVDAPLHGSMTTGEQAFGRSLLAYAYARVGRYAEAKENARRALALRPGLKEAAELLRRLP